MTTGVEKARRDHKKGRLRIKKRRFSPDELAIVHDYLRQATVECINARNALIALGGDNPPPGNLENIRYWSNIMSGLENLMKRIINTKGVQDAILLQRGA